ncbi:ATP-binding protein [Micromonospora sp. WMMD1128]|uniref:AAA family ATPase n=1 Tax=unclassified Micromonospora TaxID=2617518 RepID=UPI00248B6EC7|nr:MULTISPECIES: ATP-binding protein [unclassified Micromonospora]WBB73321.1 ATP-binding protein [Micromonospora sp. WMMD1128]WFE33274.1 ATP-binding protein [Micromonospora sp. WMMD975]
MLLRFRATNFASLRDEAELSLVATDEHPDLAVRPVPRERLNALPVVGIFGPNASGKSNVVKALGFARDAVRLSHQRWLPEEPIPGRWPFRLDADSGSRPSEFVFDFVVDDVRYEFGFSLDDEAIRQEWLYAFPKGRRQVYLEREGNSLHFGNHLTGPRELIAETVRPNSLFLSAAAALNHPQLGRIYRWFSPRQMIAAEHEPTPRRPPHCLPDDRMLALMRFADLGIVGAEIVQRDGGGAPGPMEPKIEFLHSASTEGGEATMPWQWESAGTRNWFDLLQLAVRALDAGGLLAIDDLGSELHPLLTAAFVRLFHEPATNPRGAQLIFNSHDVGLLGRHRDIRLARDQVWLTEKDETGASRLYPLSEFRVRGGLDDVEGRYLKGRYGAVPFLDHETLNLLDPSVRAA